MPRKGSSGQEGGAGGAKSSAGAAGGSSAVATAGESSAAGAVGGVPAAVTGSESVEGKPGLLVDISKLASILTQARGPILDRLSRQLPKLTGDGSVDVLEWLTNFERLCTLERAEPAEFIGFMLDGNAARVHRRMLVGDASQWEVVKGALVTEYAMPYEEAYRRFNACRLGDGESVDVYLDSLERLGGRVGLKPENLFFRVKFYEGLPALVHDWAIGREGAYTDDFTSVVARVRDRLAARRPLTARSQLAVPVSRSAASVKQSGGTRGVCYRCGGPHRVKVCPDRLKAKSAVVPPQRGPEQPSSGKRQTGCYRCGKSGHFARHCPTVAASGTSAGPVASGSGFHPEDARRGGASSAMETE